MKKEEETQVAYWLKACIELDPSMQEAAEDYLVGVLGAGVEQSVAVAGDLICLNVFLSDANPDEDRQRELKGDVECQLQDLSEIFNVSAPLVSWELLEEQDWSTNWKVHFKPFAIIPDLIIAPTWETYQKKEGETVITMDPGMAFGTGHHATTSLALAFVGQILSSADDAGRVLDVGTGTGILGMGAALLGASRVLGIDNDSDAVRIAGENVQLNHLEKVMAVAETPVDKIGESYDLVVANIIHDVLIDMGKELNRLLVSPGNLVLSGILHGEQEENIVRCYEAMGLRLKARAEREEWSALWFAKE